MRIVRAHPFRIENTGSLLLLGVPQAALPTYFASKRTSIFLPL